MILGLSHLQNQYWSMFSRVKSSGEPIIILRCPANTRICRRRELRLRTPRLV